MKCNIAMDLLPLYCENLVSEETAQDIRLHLNTCEKCSKVYSEMRDESKVRVAIKKKKNINPLKKVKKAIFLKVTGIVLMIFTVVILTVQFMFIGVPVNSENVDVRFYVLSERETYKNHPDFIEYIDHTPSDNKYVLFVEFKGKGRKVKRRFKEAHVNAMANSFGTFGIDFYYEMYQTFNPFAKKDDCTFWKNDIKMGDTLTIDFFDDFKEYNLYEEYQKALTEKDN